MLTKFFVFSLVRTAVVTSFRHRVLHRNLDRYGHVRCVTLCRSIVIKNKNYRSIARQTINPEFPEFPILISRPHRLLSVFEKVIVILTRSDDYTFWIEL